MIWTAAGSALAGITFMYAQLWFAAVPFLILAIILLTVDNQRFNRADDAYQRESDRRLRELVWSEGQRPKEEEED